MNRIAKMPLLALALVAGALVARGSDVRQVKAERRDALAISELYRRQAEVNEAEKQVRAARAALDADAAAIISEIRTHYHLTPAETFTFDPKEGVFNILPVAAPVAAVGSQ